MANFANLPLPLRLCVLFIIGVVLAGWLNLGIYWLAWNRRAISPWGPRPDRAGPRGWLDRLPVVGWFRLRREASLHGPGFWVRPLVIELLCGAGLAALYWWEVPEVSQYLRALSRHRFPTGMELAPEQTALITSTILHQHFLAHAVLFALMLVATFIDIDEKTIPDEITISGTLVGLVLAAAMPWSLLPGALVPAPPNTALMFLHIAAPLSWPPGLDGSQLKGLALGLGCFLAWCFALLPRPWYGRHGLRWALRLCVAHMTRLRHSWSVVAISLVGTAAIVAMWMRGGAAWSGLLTALLGMAVGGGIVWAVRIVGYLVMRREAMGFGDVTLMAMIGAFCGWQPCLLIFLLAPLAGALIGLITLAIGRGREIPYGPFLCLATVMVILFWAAMWSNVYMYFAMLGGWIPIIGAGSLAVMALLLAILQVIKRMVFGKLEVRS